MDEDRPITTLAHVLRRMGAYDRSRELCVELLQEAVARGDERDSDGDPGAALGRRDRLREPSGRAECAAELVELGDQQDDRSSRMYGLFQGATVLAHLGEPHEAEALARAGQELALSPVLEPWLAWGDDALGLAALARGDPATALDTSRALADATTPPAGSTRPSGMPRWRSRR